MPGSYYYSTPIGAGMSNLAQAISSMRAPGAGAGTADDGLLAARQRLIEEQIATQQAEQENTRAQGRAHTSQAAINEATLQGRNDVSRAFRDTMPPNVDNPMFNAPGVASSSLLSSLVGGPVSGAGCPGGGVAGGGGLAGAIAPPGPVPTATVAGVGQVPGAVSATGSIASALGLAPSTLDPPSAPALPAAPAAAAPITLPSGTPAPLLARAPRCLPWPAPRSRCLRRCRRVSRRPSCRGAARG